MLSNVGMNPFGPGGTGIAAGASSSPAEPGADARRAGSGESAASNTRADTNERIDPPRQSEAGVPLPDRDRRQDSPVNPAPGNRIEPRFPLASGNERLVEGEPLTGPPPAFQRSPLQEQRDEVMTPDPSPATISAPEKPEPDDARAAEPVEVARSSQSDPATPVRQAEAVSGDAHASMRSDSSESPDATTDALRDTIRRVMADTASFDVPPPPVERAQIEFTSVRRMETPYDAATVDVTR